jgi:hypothetical protein
MTDAMSAGGDTPECLHAASMDRHRRPATAFCLFSRASVTLVRMTGSIKGASRLITDHADREGHGTHNDRAQPQADFGHSKCASCAPGPTVMSGGVRQLGLGRAAAM